MEQVVINKLNGDKIRLIHHGNVSGITKAEQVMEQLGQDVVNITVVTAKKIPLSIGDWIRVFGKKYTINSTPEVTKTNDREFEHRIRFEGPQYDLIKVMYLDLDASGYSTGTTFTLMCNLKDFATIIINNAVRVHGAGSWELGECPEDTLIQNLDFTNESCLQVLQSLCQTYSYNFDIEETASGYKLHIRNRDNLLPDSFRYGRAKGLYMLERSNVSGKNVITRLFAYGSDRNIKPGYRGGSPWLKLPLQLIQGEDKNYVQDAAAIAEYGLIEGTYQFSDIYPHREGSVTAIDANDPLVFYDINMPFNLNDTSNGNTLYLISGLTAKINFTSGDLAGYQFELSSGSGYNDSLKKFTILQYTDDRGNVFPSTDTSAYRINVGDKYVITDISMPQAYINIAEQELYDAAVAYLNENSVQSTQWTLTIDQNFIKSKAPDSHTIINYFSLADKLRVIDDDLSINQDVTISGITRDIIQHYKYEITLGESRSPRSRWARINRPVLTPKSSLPAVNSSGLNISKFLKANNTGSGTTTTVTQLKWGEISW